jgi:hypothetical protein
MIIILLHICVEDQVDEILIAYDPKKNTAHEAVDVAEEWSHLRGEYYVEDSVELFDWSLDTMRPFMG